MDSSGLVLDDATASEASESLVFHIKTYHWLAAFYYSKRVFLFRVRPKMHYEYHQAIQLKVWKLNLRSLFSTFDDESFLGKIKAITVSCHGKTATTRLFQRYTLCLALLIRRHQQCEEKMFLT